MSNVLNNVIGYLSNFIIIIIFTIKVHTNYINFLNIYKYMIYIGHT